MIRDERDETGNEKKKKKSKRKKGIAERGCGGGRGVMLLLEYILENDTRENKFHTRSNT